MRPWNVPDDLDFEAMNIRTSSCVASSLSAAAFRTVSAHDTGGLVYRIRREIGTMRRLRLKPYLAPLTFARSGCIHTSQDIQTMTARLLVAKVAS
jgi:hypothetical protein